MSLSVLRYNMLFHENISLNPPTDNIKTSKTAEDILATLLIKSIAKRLLSLHNGIDWLFGLQR